MNITICGSGNVGGALAGGWKKAGHSVTFAARDPNGAKDAELELALGFSDSAGETVARLASGAKVVKAFNTTGANNMANSAYASGKLMMPVAGDDSEAKKPGRGLLPISASSRSMPGRSR